MAANNYFGWAVSLYRFIKRDTARAEEVNSALDEISNGFTAVETKTNAALKLPDGETATPFAVAATRKGKLVSFNATTGAVETTITAADVSPVAAIAAEVMAVSGIAADVPTVAGISGNVTTVATIAADVPTVAGISGNVTTVATNNANVSTVATNISNVGTVAGISANVTTVAGISGNVTTVAGNNAAVSTCANNIAAIIAAPDYAAALHGTSTTSLAIGTGAKTFTTQTGKQFAAGQYVIAVSDANAANYMFGAVTGYAGTSLEINVISIGGSGTFADWTINLSGARGAAGADSVLTGLTAGKAQQVDQTVASTVRAATTDFTGESLEGTLSDTGVAITAFHGVAGVTYKRKCLGAGDITAGAGLTILQGGASITTAAGDTFEVYMLTSTTCEVRNYQRAVDPKLAENALAVGNTANSAANNALAGSFYGATVQNVLASRAMGVTYTNTSGRPIIVSIVADGVVNALHDIGVRVNNGLILQERFSVAGEHRSVVFFVPAGATYVAIPVGANPALVLWHEVRL